jgi:hypothetical protein
VALPAVHASRLVHEQPTELVTAVGPWWTGSHGAIPGQSSAASDREAWSVLLFSRR